MEEAEKVLDVIFPAGHQAAEVVHPGKQPFYFPASAVAAQLASVLRLGSTPAMGRDHVDAVFGGKLFVEPIRVVCLVADEPGWEFVEEACSQNLFHKLTLGWRSALHRYGERKTVASGESEDLGALAAARGADGKAPFLALAKVASTNASSRFSRPRSCRCFANNRNPSSSLPLRTHCWNRRWQVWNGGYFSGNSRHCAPVPNTQSTPLSTARVSCQGRPRLSVRRAGRNTGSTTAHCSSVSSQRPLIGPFGDRQSFSRMPSNQHSDVYETGSNVVKAVSLEASERGMSLPTLCEIPCPSGANIHVPAYGNLHNK